MKTALNTSGRIVSRLTSQRGWSLLGFLLASLLTGCALLPGNSDGSSMAAGSSDQARIVITSSPALLPLISATAVLFERQHPQVQIDIRTSELRDGLNEVGSQRAAMAATIRYADPSIALSKNLVDQLIGIVPLTIIGQPGIALPSLSYEQMLGIFSTGTITNWKQIGGPDQKIVVVVPPISSDVRFLFRDEMLGGAPETSTVLQTDSLEMIPQVVARTPGSISYLPEPFLTADVHRTAIDGVQPSAETIGTGHYSFWSFAHLYTEEGRGSSGAKETDEGNKMRTMYLQFLQSTAGDSLARQLGYIPLSAIQVPPMPEPSAATLLPSSVSTSREGS